MKKSTVPWRKSQQETIALVGGKEVPGGGVSPGYTGDGRSDTYLIEHKYTNKPYLRIQKMWLRKIWQDAMLAGKEAMFTCEIRNSKYKAIVKGVGNYEEGDTLSIDETTVMPFVFSFDGKILWEFERIE